ncbi:hypothetical protein ONZ43_g6071 [Nemania bipapillata]|uniref:Uncharacterized protein n=1 Tax=Nemania bipapillata TaxID=110536 RepID=A0ACC2I380_9PEZI|nr:hypothetical protein ONZ43_g6071 [Nemania bipapillata]
MFPGQSNNWSPLIEIPHGMASLGPPGGAQGDDSLSLSGSPQGTPDIHPHHAIPQQDLYQENTGPSPASHSSIDLSSHMQHNELPHEIDGSENAFSPIEEQMMQDSGPYPIEVQVAGVDASRFAVLDESSEAGSRNSATHSLADDLIKTDDGPSDPIKPEGLSAHRTGPFDLDWNDPIEMSKLVECLQSRGVLEQHGYKKESPEEAVGFSKTEDDLAVNQNQTSHSCSTCKKTFPRRCELK